MGGRPRRNHGALEWQKNRMSPWLTIVRTQRLGRPLGYPHAPRRKGSKAGTVELALHRNYIVMFAQTDTTVTVFNLLHVARRYP